MVTPHVPWRFVAPLLLVAVLAIPVMRAAAQEQPPIRIVFMHHSTGQGLMDGGDVRAALTDLGYAFWDHGYNEEGVTDASGTRLGTHWDVPYDNTDPVGWAGIFQQPVTDPPENTFSHMLTFDVIVFKSCFPASDIQSDDQLAAYESFFQTIRDTIDRHPDKLFVAFTPPPLVPNATTPAAATRAERWASYLASPAFRDGHPNLIVFDLFHLLADDDGTLRAEYRGDEYDSHPNALANREAGGELVRVIDEAIRAFWPDRGAQNAPALVEPGSAAQDAPVMVEPGSAAQDAPVMVEPDRDEAGVLWALDLETPLREDERWTYGNGGVALFECAQVTPGHASATALQLAYAFAEGGTAGCGIPVQADESWRAARALRLSWWASNPGLTMRVAVGVASAEAPEAEAAPFEATLVSGSAGWTTVVLPLDTLTKAEWFAGGADALDPARIVWVDLDVGMWDVAQSGVVRVDDLALMAE